MKKILLLIGIILIGIICQAQEKKFKLTPLTAKDFDGSLPDKKMIQGVFDTGSVLKSLPANRLNDYYKQKTYEMEIREIDSEEDQAVRRISWKYKDDSLAREQKFNLKMEADERKFNSEQQAIEREIQASDRRLELINEQISELNREKEYGYRQERTNSILNASRLVIDLIGGNMGATIPDYYNQDQYYRVQPFEDHMNEILLNQFLWDRVFPLPSPPKININE
jgi:hypothetical protein